MKKILFTILAGSLAFASCMNDWDTIEVSNDLFSNDTIGEATTDINQIRSTYASVINSSSYQQVTSDDVIEGIVVANDISGNIYQYIYIQGIDKKTIITDGDTIIKESLNTSEGGIGVGIKGLGCLYTLYPVGQRIRVSLKGLYVGGYGQSPRIGMPYINTNGAMRMGPMSLEMMKSHIRKIGNPEPDMVTAREITASDLTANKITALTPLLVVMKNSTISDAGWPYAHWEVGGDTYSEYHDININGTNVKQLLYTSTSATFAGDTIQSGTKTIYGLLNRYSSSYQLSLRSLEDVIETEK